MKDVWGHSGSMDQSLSELEIRHRTLAREAAVEGIVLLKNEGVLPLSTASAIALLGSGAEKTIKGGIGSGDVNNRENISIPARTGWRIMKNVIKTHEMSGKKKSLRMQST